MSKWGSPLCLEWDCPFSCLQLSVVVDTEGRPWTLLLAKCSSLPISSIHCFPLQTYNHQDWPASPHKKISYELSHSNLQMDPLYNLYSDRTPHSSPIPQALSLCPWEPSHALAKFLYQCTFWPISSCFILIKIWLSWWFSGLRNRHCLCEDIGSIPGLTQWVKDPILPQTVA